MSVFQYRCFLLCFLLLCGRLDAATLYAVVSDNSAPDLASGAAKFADQYPDHRLVFRSTSQLMATPETVLRQQLQKADAVLILGVFGDAAQRLAVSLSPRASTTTLLAIHSDKRLERLSQHQGTPLLDNVSDPQLAELAQQLNASDDSAAWLRQTLAQYPDASLWWQARVYWHHRGTANIAQLIALVLQDSDPDIRVEPARALEPIRYFHAGDIRPLHQINTQTDQPLVAILDLDSGDRADNLALLRSLCDDIARKAMQCVGIIAPWGSKTLAALQVLQQGRIKGKLGAIIALQDFLLGGGEQREHATALLQQLDVPVLKGIRLHDRTESKWLLAQDGIPVDAVHYRIAMPEAQGISQPLVLATASEPVADALTGLVFRFSVPNTTQIAAIAERISGWTRLQHTPNAEKRLAIIYYNHPPGRHNIGADNLDVPATLFDLLHLLKSNGYHTGTLPDSPAQLLELLQDRGINLPEDHAALTAMAPRVTRVPAEDYGRWFAAFPPALRSELIDGPLGYLHHTIVRALQSRQPQLADTARQQVLTDVLHLLEGVDHPARNRAMKLVRQLDDTYQQLALGKATADQAQQLVSAIVATGIEGVRGWGPPPGRVMVVNNELLLPGLQFGNVFIGPQPPRGWEVNEELLHANLSVPPPHQYLALYQWLKHGFKADALIHLGRHSTYEFLPRHATGLSDEDYSPLIAGNLPGIYPYIVDGVGEGIQAKRRGLAVMIDHLTPPLSTPPLYDDLLTLRQLIESYEASSNDRNEPAAQRAVHTMRELIDKLNLRDELIASMDAELQVRGISFDEVNDDLLVHEIGHYLTQLQERFMPMGLHVFGRDWDAAAQKTLLDSMLAGKDAPPELQQRLAQSPALERQALLHALDGGFVAPGKGNDPIRTPDALPTGRNFHSLDGSLLPTRLGYAMGAELAESAQQTRRIAEDGKEAVILWASDVVRDEGTMIGFGLHLLGIKPVWNSRGILQGVERLPLDKTQHRYDTVFITSGLFRDLYGQQLELLDRAVLVALAGSGKTIRRSFPELVPALQSALAPLANAVDESSEPLDRNQVARNWVKETRALLAEHLAADVAGRSASLRLFGSAPGTYGAGINTQAERSGSWQDRGELGASYLNRMGHAYGNALRGTARQDLFQRQLANISNTYLGRSSNLYGLIDNNDVFDYLGGLSLAVESQSGQTPANHVMQYADSNRPQVQSLDTALLQELRGRFLNPAWMQALMQHDYAGARTMGSGFFENLWGWQVTNPDIVKSWIWDEVKAVYLDDRYQLGMDEFLQAGHNQHVKANMLAIFLVAAMKGFWQTDAETLQAISEALLQLIQANGLPGSGHTSPDHPVFDFMSTHLSAEQAATLQQILQQAKGPQRDAGDIITSITEITSVDESNPDTTEQNTDGGEQHQPVIFGLVLLAALLLLGALNGRRIHLR